MAKYHTITFLILSTLLSCSNFKMKRNIANDTTGNPINPLESVEFFGVDKPEIINSDSIDYSCNLRNKLYNTDYKEIGEREGASSSSMIYISRQEKKVWFFYNPNADTNDINLRPLSAVSLPISKTNYLNRTNFPLFFDNKAEVESSLNNSHWFTKFSKEKMVENLIQIEFENKYHHIMNPFRFTHMILLHRSENKKLKNGSKKVELIVKLEGHGFREMVRKPYLEHILDDGNVQGFLNAYRKKVLPPVIFECKYLK